MSVPRHVVLILALALGAAACGDAPPVRVASTTPSTTTPEIVGPGECNDTSTGGLASCAAGFKVGDQGYTLSCGAVRPDVVTEDVLATGRYAGQQTEIRRIAGVDPKILVAVKLGGGACGDNDVVLSPWSMAFFGNPGQDAATHDAICTASVKEHLARNGCV
jgi:hypothetical protein